MDYSVSSVKEIGGIGGSLINFIARDDLAVKTFGQINCITITQGCVKGNHYHKAKEEWLISLQGKVRVVLKELSTEKTEEVILDSKLPRERLRIGRNIGHAVQCLSDETAILVEYCSEPFNPGQEDRFSCYVIEKDL